MTVPSPSLSLVVAAFDERTPVAESVRRLLAADPRFGRLELIAVADATTSEGLRATLRALERESPGRVRLVEHRTGPDRMAAVSSGIALATGDVTIVQAAGLECDAEDVVRLIEPLLSGEADAVFGSRPIGPSTRFLGGVHRRLSGLELSDVAPRTQAVRTRLLQSIPLRSHGARIGIELAFKLHKRGARIREVAIGDAGRTRGPDGWGALGTMLHWWLIDDLYRPDMYGSNILVSMSDVPKFNGWMADAIRPHCGKRVLEIGAGIGNMTLHLCPRERYTATDIDPLYLDFLGGAFQGRAYLDVRRCDLADARDFEPLEGRYDTVVCLNVLEHVEAEALALANVRRALVPEGRFVVLVPQDPALYGTLDEVLEHVRRYTRTSLTRALEQAGFEVETLFDFNRATKWAWWWNGRVLKRRHFGRVQLKGLNSLVWAIRRLDPVLPWQGTSLVAVARKRSVQ